MDKKSIQDFKKYYRAMHSNNDIFEQKIKVVGKRIVEGKTKFDKEGNLLHDKNGEIEKWDDTYYLTFVSLNNGGTHSTKISQENYEKLKLNNIYIAKGKIDYITFKDNFNSTPIVVFENFEDELTGLVAQLEMEESSKV